MTLAQDASGIDWKPLNKFRRGVNTSGVYGNNIREWMIGPTNQWTQYPGSPFGIGGDTTNAACIAPTLVMEDFVEMAKDPTGHDRLFDHVIFNIDPHTFGADPVTGTIPSPLQNVYVDGVAGLGGNSVKANFEALVDDIKAARGEGLAVVIAMHATVATPQTEQSYRAGITGFTNPMRVYPGPYKVHLYTRGTINQNALIKDTHPLPSFWKSFVGHFVDVMAQKNALLGNDIAFRLGGESLAGFNDKTFWGPGCYPYVPGVPASFWSSQLGLPDDAWREVAAKYWGYIKSDYRAIELEAIKAVWGYYPQTRICRILASPGEPWPGEFGRTQSWTAFETVPDGSFTYAPYQPSELSSGDNPIPGDLAGRIGYAMHIYEPFVYTHAKGAALHNEAHRTLLAYQGNENGPGDQVSWQGPGPDQSWEAYETSQAPGRITIYKDYVLRKLSNPQGDETIDPFEKWHEDHGRPPVLVTEFGAQDRQFTNDGVVLPPEYPGEALPSHRLMRARWTYDVRTWLELRGIGWSVWDMWDTFPVYRGAFRKRLGGGQWDLRPAVRYNESSHGDSNSTYPAFFWYMGEALFSEDRP